MKVLFINAVCGTGSTGNLIAGLIARLRASSGHGLAAYGIRRSHKVLPGESFKFNTMAGYYLHNALSRLTDHTGLYSGLQTRYLIRKIKAYDPDVIHLHNLHGYYINYEILFRYLAGAGKPVVWTLHDCWAMTGHCTHFVGADCGQWKRGCEKCSLLREYPTCYTRGDVAGNYGRKKAAFTAVDHMTIAVPSRWLGELAKQSFLGKYLVEVIPNGIDTDIFHPRASDFRAHWGLQDKKIVLGVASVWSEKKGLGDFYRLAQMLPGDYRIVLVGLTDQQIQQLPDGILGIARTESAAALAEIYSAADVFANPTYEDTYPTVNLEAQACGTPVVSYDVCGCSETILPGCGETISCGDIETLCRIVSAWCDRSDPIPADRARLSKDTCYDAYCKLYSRLLK